MNLIDTKEFREIESFWAHKGFASLGFSGSSMGMDSGQFRSLRDILRIAAGCVGVVQFHFVGRRGADEEAYHEARRVGCVTVMHPHADGQGHMSLHISRTIIPHEKRVAWQPIKADEDIVRECSLILLAPALGPELDHIHTWDIGNLARRNRVAVATLAPAPRVGRA